MNNRDRETFSEVVFEILEFPYKKLRAFLWHCFLFTLTIFGIGVLIDLVHLTQVGLRTLRNILESLN